MGKTVIPRSEEPGNALGEVALPGRLPPFIPSKVIFQAKPGAHFIPIPPQPPGALSRLFTRCRGESCAPTKRCHSRPRGGGGETRTPCPRSVVAGRPRHVPHSFAVRVPRPFTEDDATTARERSERTAESPWLALRARTEAVVLPVS